MNKLDNYRNEMYPNFVNTTLITNGRVETLTTKLL